MPEPEEAKEVVAPADGAEPEHAGANEVRAQIDINGIDPPDDITIRFAISSFTNP